MRPQQMFRLVDNVVGSQCPSARVFSMQIAWRYHGHLIDSMMSQIEASTGQSLRRITVYRAPRQLLTSQMSPTQFL